MKFGKPCVCTLIIITFATFPCHPALGNDDAEETTLREFHSAIAKGELKDIREMLAAHADLLNEPLPEEKQSQQLTPLQTAIDAGQLAAVSALIKAGADLELKVDGWTPLFRAAVKGNSDIAIKLLDAGADVNGGSDATNLADITPIRAAVMFGHLELARLLLHHGARMDVFSAAGLGWDKYVKDQLAQNPGLAKTKDNWQYCPLWLAVNGGCAATAEMLINAGADVNDDLHMHGISVLHVAAAHGCGQLIDLLIQHGANVNAADGNGKTPMDYAVANKQTEAAEILRKQGGVHVN